MSLVSFGDSDEELDSSDFQSDVEPLLQHHDSSNRKVKELKKGSTITNGLPKAEDTTGSLGPEREVSSLREREEGESQAVPGPAGRRYRLTNMAAGTGS